MSISTPEPLPNETQQAYEAAVAAVLQHLPACRDAPILEENADADAPWETDLDESLRACAPLAALHDQYEPVLRGTALGAETLLANLARLTEDVHFAGQPSPQDEATTARDTIRYHLRGAVADLERWSARDKPPLRPFHFDSSQASWVRQLSADERSVGALRRQFLQLAFHQSPDYVRHRRLSAWLRIARAQHGVREQALRQSSQRPERRAAWQAYLEAVDTLITAHETALQALRQGTADADAVHLARCDAAHTQWQARWKAERARADQDER